MMDKKYFFGTDRWSIPNLTSNNFGMPYIEYLVYSTSYKLETVFSAFLRKSHQNFVTKRAQQNTRIRLKTQMPLTKSRCVFQLEFLVHLTIVFCRRLQLPKTLTAVSSIRTCNENMHIYFLNNDLFWKFGFLVPKRKSGKVMNAFWY